MGKLIYGARKIDVPDRPLAHLQAVMVDKLRRGETFSLTLSADGAQKTMIFGPSVQVMFEYASNRTPRLNRNWLKRLSEVGYAGDGLQLVAEPDDPDES
ncbi:ATP-dependent DNA ligase [Agromyces sp. G08B096]|uniref:ATP-dependent DNA ligase n=1 Tax=Agromyces sp. G08B096 TaxID=3156399 RepID=A0AAU7W8J2_9MICO